MKRIGVVVRANSAHGEAVMSELRAWLDKKGREMVLIQSPAKQDKAPQVDMILILGGDGTLISVARLLDGMDIPILGVNLGHLGFLTDVTLGELFSVLEDVLSNRFKFDHRLMLRSRVRRESGIHRQPAALNEVAIHSGTLTKMIHLEISVDGQFVTHLRGDGVIIASPTGSTAYSLSAGGPIIHPSVDALLLTPISPHMLSNRPIVIPGRSRVEVVVQTEEPGPAVTSDGQVGFPLQKGDTVEVMASESRLKLITSPQRNHYQILREKLKWGEG